MNMETERAAPRILTPEEEQALKLGKQLIRACEDIYQGKFEGKSIDLPISYNGGFIKASLETTPTRIETRLEYNDDEQVVNVWYKYKWDAKEQSWKLDT